MLSKLALLTIICDWLGFLTTTALCQTKIRKYEVIEWVINEVAAIQSPYTKYYLVHKHLMSSKTHPKIVDRSMRAFNPTFSHIGIFPMTLLTS